MILTYDLETTGFITRSIPLSDPKQPNIVQLAAILDDDGKEIMRLDVTCAVEFVPDKAADIHGITTERSQKIGVNEHTAVQLLLDMIEVADVVVGHNIKAYDNDLVIGAARRIIENEGYDPFAGKNIFDTLLAGVHVCRIPWRGGSFKKPKLTELYVKLFGHEFANPHQAISDVLASRACFYEMQRLLNSQAV